MTAITTATAQKALVLYYSETGTTKTVAEELQQQLGADIEAVEAVEPYTGNFQETIQRGQREMQSGQWPAIKPLKSAIKNYDVIFLGYPNWCGTMPMALWTFLESHDFTDKTIYPFCTHEGSGVGHSLEDIHALCPTAKLGKSLALLGTTIEDAEDDIRRWLRD